MEAVLGGRAGPAPGRPGWWATSLVVVLGAVLGGVVLTLMQALVLTPATGLWTDANGFGTPAIPQPLGTVAWAANGAASVFSLAVLTLAVRGAARGWMDHPPALSWIALGLGLGGYGPFLNGVLGHGGGPGFVVALVVLRYAAFDADGVPQPGALATLHGRERRWAVALVAAVPVLCLMGACAYGVTHPVHMATNAGGGRGPAKVTAVDEPARRVTLPLYPTVHRPVTLLAVRGGHVAPSLRLLAVGETPAGARNAGKRAAAPVLPMRLGAFPPIAWVAAPRCPAAPDHVRAIEVKVRSATGTRWIALRIEPPIALPCVHLKPHT